MYDLAQKGFSTLQRVVDLIREEINKQPAPSPSPIVRRSIVSNVSRVKHLPSVTPRPRTEFSRLVAQLNERGAGP